MRFLRFAGPLAILFLALLQPVAFTEGDSPPQDTPVAGGIQRERVNLVLIDVVVTDRKGRPVDDLRPEEFFLRVDGNPHPIESIELRLAGLGVEEPRRETAPGIPGAVPAFVGRSPRRFIFFFDGLNCERGLGPRPIQAVRMFLRKGLLPGDEVMVAGLGRDLRIYQELTADPALMLKALDAVESDLDLRTRGENRTRDNFRALAEQERFLADCGWACTRGIWYPTQAILDMAAGFAQEDRPRILRTLAALKALVAALHAGTGRKELFFLTDGFPDDPDALYGAVSDSGSLEPEILHLAREAGAAQVVIHTVNTLGLTRSGTVEARIESVASRTLAALSLGTGGLAQRNSNDFLPPLEKVERETRAAYVVSYVPAGDPDGQYHAIRVEVLRKGVRVRAREGFIYMTPEQIQERQLFAAFVSPDLYHDFPVGLETLTYLGDGGKQVVEFAFEVPDRMLLFLPREGYYTARLEAGLVLRHGKSEVADQFSRTVDVRLDPREMAAQNRVTLLARREVPPGDYEAVAVVRDLGTGNVGTFRTRVRIPAITADRIAMSSLVLESPEAEGPRVDLYPVASGEPDLAAAAGRRIFPRGAQVRASSLIYHPQRREGTGEVVIRVMGQIRKGAEPVREFSPAVHVFTADQGAKAIPLRIPISLEGLEPGVYSLQIQVLDEVGKQGVGQSIEFMVQ